MPLLEAIRGRDCGPTFEAVRGHDIKSDLHPCLRLFEAAVLDPTSKGGGGERWGVGEQSERGVPASEASLPPEASQVVAEGDGLRVQK